MPPGLHFSNMLCKFLQGDSLTRNYDLISILLDMSSYRLVSLTLPMKIHLFQIRSIYEALYSCEYTLGSIEISALLEQVSNQGHNVTSI
jgi:hypothetical protein